ncbi:MAG: enoyl-CoA hydratase/carnithine racemase [Flavobacteriales bacterium]|jgi:enoyl-CoA hydratase/carnithine racemase|tara:strand:- start:282 stop:1157 length:876 start_codon:yes stop_codon:yes gene_type:complete
MWVLMKTITGHKMTPDQFRDISYNKDAAGIVTLTFNTPKRKNALSMYSFYEVYCAVDMFEKDDSAYAMIITGAVAEGDKPEKEAYSSGGYFNPDALDGVPEATVQLLDPSDIAQKRTTLKMYQCDKPIIAAVNGLAIGGAFTLTFAGCDQIYLSENAWVQLPFSKLSLCPELASSFLLPRLLGMHRTKELIYFAEKLSAQQAVALQLANKVVPHDELMTYARGKAMQLIPPDGASLAIREMKKLLHAPLIDDVSHALDRENEALNKLTKSDDFMEGLMARIERRPAVYKGA